MPEERGLDQSYRQRKSSWWRQSEKYKSSNINLTFQGENQDINDNA